MGHQKAVCPFRRTEGGALGGSGSPGVVETSNKNGKGQKGKGKTKDSSEKGDKGKGGKPSPNTPPKVQAAQKEEEKPTTASTRSTDGNVAKDKDGKTQEMKGSGSTGEAPLMTEAVQLLKKLAASTINMMSIKSLKMSRALLDSGATHALRMAVSEEERLSGQPTRVVLADGETDQSRMKKGTRMLLAPWQGAETSSMILPMHEVSAAGRFP